MWFADDQEMTAASEGGLQKLMDGLNIKKRRRCNKHNN